MSYRTAAVRDSMVRGSIVQWLFLFLLALIATDSAAAQDLAFTPGQYGIYAGNTVSPSKSGPSLSPPGYTGTAADLVMGGPGGLVFDSVGNLYIMDQGNAILRVVAAGSTPIPTLPGVAVQAGHVYTVAGTTNGYGSTIPCDGGTDLQGDGCPATLGAIKYVYGIAVDKNGNVYIADYATNQIRAVYGGTGGLPGITNPQAGYIYALTNAIDSTTASTESGDNGPDTAAIDPDPYYVAVDSYGNIYFTDGRDTNVRFIYNSGNLPANFFPTGVTPTQGYIYLLTAGTGTCPNPKVKMVGTRTIKLAGACDGSPVGEAYFQTDAMAIAIDSSNNIYLQDKSSEEIQAVYVSGNLPGLDSSTLTVGNLYDVAGTSAEGVPVLNGPALQSPLYISGQASGGFQGLYVDKAGNLYFNGSISSASGEDRIFKVDPSGILTIVYGGTTLCTVTPINNSNEPPVDQQIIGCGSTSVPDLSDNGMTIDANGNLYISNEVNLGSNIIEESNVGTSAVAYTGTIGIATPNQTVTISNTGAQALQLSDLSFTGPYSQVPTGATDCSSTTSLAVGASCQIGVSFLPTTPGTEGGTLVVTSNALNAEGGVNTVNLSGTAAQATSITALTASPGGVVVANLAQTVTLTATVAPQIGDTLTPTGSITFMDGSATVGTSNLNGTTATLNATTLAAGTHTLTAVYSGDVNFITSTSAPFQVTVSSSPVAVVSIASSAASVNSGQSVTFTANVAAFSGSGTPAGTVSFQDGANPLPNSTVTLSGSTATYTTTALPAGNNQVIAVYNGNSSFGANDSTPVSVQVNAAGVLQFSPGIISLVSGSYFTASGAPASGSAANAAQYSPGSVAVDSYGNTYTVGPSTSSIYEATAVYVTASGKGPIPGISNPTAGDIYLLGASTACATATTSACGDGGPIASAFFNAPGALAVDALNNLYVVDDEEIRKVSAITGIVTNLGGTYGKAGYTGDNGLATAATLTVSTLFVDASGNIYIADNRDALIRRIDGLTGVISHIAGLPPVNTYTPTLCAALPCGAGGLAVNAGLIGPKGIFVDQSGNVYFGDSGYDLGGNINIIRRIDGQTGIISLYAGQYFPPGLTYPGPCDPQSGVSCGDGGPATSALMNNITDITGDETGNIYIADSSLATIRQINAKTGIINTIVGNATTEGSGTATNICSAAPCGDGSAANVAELKSPQSVAVDPQGNIYIADSGTYTVREVTGSTTTLAFGSQTLGSLTGQAVSLTNLGNQPVDISAVTVPSSFPQQASSGSDCTSTTTLAAGDQCELDLAFFPTVTGVVSQTATIASNSTNATSGVNSITLTGTGVSAGGTQAQTITFTPPAGPFYAGQQVPLTATADSGLQVEYLVSSGSAIVENNGTASAELKINGPGKIIVTAYQFGNEQYAPANPVQVSLTAATPVLTFTATVPSIAVGAPLPVYTSAADYTVTGLIGNDTASAITGQPTITVLDANGNVIAPGTVLDAGVYQVAIAQGTLSFPSYYQPAFVNGTLSVTGVNQQTISFTGLPANIPYAGAATYTLNAVADDAITGKPDGQPITYSVTGPATVSGSTLTITGAGTVVVTATQSGSTYYNAASATETIQVSKATLTVTAVSLTYAQGVPLPALTSSSSYTITGFAQGDNLSSVSGQPALAVIDTNGLTGPAGSVLASGATPPDGAYAISISVGQLSSANYDFNFVNGTLTINGGTSQTINFPAIPPVTYGAAPITLGATSTSGLAVSYTVSPSNLATLSGTTLTITGAGTLTITATQPGNSAYAPAKPAQQTLTIAPATLTVTAGNTSRANDTPNPAFTYTITGFVNGDIAGTAVSGLPSLYTSATVTSPVGQYPIDFNLNSGTNQSGSLVSANYVFSYIPGVLTIATGGPTPDFSITASPQAVSVAQGQIVQAQITLLPVNYYQGLVNLSCGSLPSNVTCTFSPASLTAIGNNAAVTTMLTINTNSASPVVGALRGAGKPSATLAAIYWLPGVLLGAFLLIMRRRLRWSGRITMLAVLLLLIAASALTACGGGASSASSSLAQPGSNTFTVTATDSTGAATHNISISLTVR